MRFLKFLALTLVVAMGFSSCNPKDNHDHSSDLAGTWTCLTADFAEAMVINEDGSVVSTILVEGNYLENMSGNIVVENDNVTLSFEDGTKVEGHFDIIPGMAFSIENENVGRMTFNYCEEDLSEEILGMWVCNDSKIDAENDMMIQTFDANGKTYLTGFLPMGGNPEFILNDSTDYKVVGDLMFLAVPAEFVGGDKPKYIAERLIYTPKATSFGDVMTFTNYSGENNELLSESWLRVKQYLNLEGEVYAYSTAYVSNAKGTDEDLSMLGHTFNMANIGAVDFDVVFGADLYIVELNAESITHKFRPNGQDVEVVTPITVEGNKVTLDYSAVNPSCRKVEMYMFQDKDDTQLHMYMSTASFVNYFANLWLPELIAEGELDPTDTSAVEKVYKDMEARVESINVSFVMKALK